MFLVLMLLFIRDLGTKDFLFKKNHPVSMLVVVVECFNWDIWNEKVFGQFEHFNWVLTLQNQVIHCTDLAIIGKFISAIFDS